MKRFAATAVPLDAVSLVEASAGTGKTYAITTLVLRLLLERGLAIDQILVVTFTEAATAELRGRVRARLREGLAAFERGEREGELGALVSASDDVARDTLRLSVALQHVDEAPIHTIHGFCHRVLADSAFESGVQFDAELSTDDKPLRDDVLLDFWTSELMGATSAEVRAIRDAGLKPDSCRRLADAVLRAPYMAVLPPVMERPRAPDRRKLEAAFDIMRVAWDRAPILELLTTTALNKNRYKESSIGALVDSVDALLARPAPDAPKREPWLAKMTASALLAACKKGRQSECPRHPFFDAAEIYLAEVAPFEQWATDRALWFKRRLCDFVRVQMPRRKEQLGTMSFDDLLLRVDDALAGPEGARLAATVRARYPAALIDEFQDTDPVQWAIFEKIWREGTMFLIGDPKQAIYAFRGADVFAYMAAARDVPAPRCYTMDVNWRSDPAAVAGVRAIFGRAARPFVMTDITFPEVRARDGAADVLSPGADAAVSEAAWRSGLSVAFVPRALGEKTLRREAIEQIAPAVAADIAALLRSDARIDGRRVHAGDIAILTRTNQQAFDAQRALRALRIPSVVMGDQSVFEENQPEAREVALVLAAAAEPTESGALRAALTTEIIGVSAVELAAMDARAEASGDGTWSQWVERFRELHAIWSQRGFVQMFRAMLHVADVERRLLRLDDGERRLTNLLHLMELLHTAARNLHLGPAGLIHWLGLQRSEENARARPEAAQIRLESDAHAVKITTIHKSKGLEYAIVYCPYSWDGTALFGDDKKSLLFHDPDDGDVAKLDLAPDEGGAHMERALWERLAENVRLLYVALTRARHRTTVVWGAFRGADKSALGYLLHPPPLIGGKGPALDDIEAHLAGASDQRMLSELSESGIAVSTLAPWVGPRDDAPTVETEPLCVREVSTPVGRWWRTASFSELSSSRSPRSHDEGHDRDERVAPLDTRHAPSDARRPITLAEFPRGPKAGTFFHALLEHLDFAEDERAALVAAELSAHGFDLVHAPRIERALGEVLDTGLTMWRGRRRFTLRHLGREHRIDELEFYLPVGSASAATVVPRGTQLSLLFPDQRSSDGAVVRLGPLTARKLASVFSDHPSEQLLAGYAERVAQLAFLPLEGYLKGYIDMVYVHDQRWYVVDYKTNHLGDDVSDYGRDQLQQAMAHGHYYLQSHLYALALHRHLTRTLLGYEFKRHFGGIQYLFIKGMTPESHDTGVFFERPPLARLMALSDLLERPPLTTEDK